MTAITDREMQAAATGENVWLTEDAPKGHGRFMGRITKSGDRLFYYRYTALDGKSVFLPIGCYDPKGRTGLTLKDARARAGELSRLYVSGVKDIKGHLAREMELQEAQQAAERARLHAEPQAAERAAHITATRITVSELFDRWESVVLIGRKDGGKEIRRIFDKDVLPRIGGMPVEDVKKGHVTGVTDAQLARGVDRLAKLTFASMRQMFRFAQDRDILEADPTASIRKAAIGGKAVERDRVLSEDEIRELQRRIPTANLSQATECAIWLCLSTGCRIGELLKARWEHIDLDNGEWLIPEENSKNERAHKVFLSSLAIIKFRALHKVHPEGPWCYPNRKGDGHVCVKTTTVQLIDRQRPGRDPLSNRVQATDALSLKGGRWTSHDLRRTAATMMVALGVLPEVAERCLNHVEENRIKRTYQRHSYEPEMREAWRLLGDRLDLLTRNDADNVVTFKRAA